MHTKTLYRMVSEGVAELVTTLLAMQILTRRTGHYQFNCSVGTNIITEFQLGIDTKTANCEIS